MRVENPIASGLTYLLQQGASLSSVDMARLVMASAIPLVGSVLWHFCRTVIDVSDEEQEMWIQMWLSQQTAALSRVRQLSLLSPSANQGRRHMDPFGGGRRRNKEDGDHDKEDGEEGRFAPPKLEFQPATGIKAWAWFGWWPVSVASTLPSKGGGMDPFVASRVFGGGGSRAGYTITVWFAPSGTRVVKALLLQGRQAWLNKRAKRTEIWTVDGNRGPGGFKIITKPSRPLSSVIVEGRIKEDLKQDAISFLNAEKWYVGKGIPYRRGYLLHGPPGCGKTSLITALAGELRLPIVLVPLNDRNMDDRGLMQILSEAPKDSLVLIEDIDCALPRDTGETSEMAMMQMRGRLPVTLSGLLNAIDGVSAQEGRLLFMTTNYPDRLDDALIRPGRVDVKFRLGKASKQAAGELYDQFFGDHDNNSHHAARAAFLGQVEDGVHSFAALQGVLMAAKDDPLLAAKGMDQLPKGGEAEPMDPTKDRSAYNAVMKMKKTSEDALEKEKANEEEQRQAGVVVVKRLIGNPVGNVHSTESRQIMFGGFSTFGAPEKLVTAGVLYYEMQVLKAHGLPQFGFSLKDGIPIANANTGVGTGDNNRSWALDGMRKRKWHGADIPWKGSWKDGDVIGLAANVDKGMIAVSKNGDWGEKEENGFGVVFCDKKIQQGVFPCFTGQGYTARYAFEEEHLKHKAPPASIWEEEKEGSKEEKVASK